MTKISFSASFQRAFKKIINARPDLEVTIRDKFEIFQRDPFDPILRTHKLSGKLKAYRSFSITHDIRVIFEFVKSDEALFTDIGSHDEVY